VGFVLNDRIGEARMHRGSRLVTAAIVGVVAALAGMGTQSEPAAATVLVSYQATVTAVTDGDTLIARTAEGGALTVQVIGIDAPEPGECGAADARTALEDLAQGQAVTLRGDPTPLGSPTPQGIAPLANSGLYVDRADGLDVGLELVRRGWAMVVDAPPFVRRAAYLEAEQDALEGVWADCDGDFHQTRADGLHALGDPASAFVRRYYRRVSNNQFRAAWEMLGGPVKRRLGHGFRRWRSSHRGSLSVSARTPRFRVAGGRLVVSARLRSRDRDVCNGRVVVQRFRGTVGVAPRDDSFAIVRFRIHKVAGGTPRLSKSQCPPPPKPQPDPGGSPPPPSVDCQGYSPCLPPGSDVDCAGGSGDGPRYVEGPVRVSGSDPYDLDRDGDGTGCDS
jgi:endonuclease YncB( thermonuclease family)